ncbi:peptidase S1 [Phytohabitans rumicis]|uniref:Peptidase S1 n=1 Tax=Phytohabitans rumicis TaxID=1076125 RepID=A0A6V8KWP0_9ACTN|nr:peptidase S1 [Phytohabitans rumicis]
MREQSDSSPGVAPVSDAPTAPVPATPAPEPAPAPAPAPPSAAPAPGPYAPPPSPWQHPDRAQQPVWPGNAGYAAPAPVGAGVGMPAHGAPQPPHGGLPPHGAPPQGPVPPGQPPIWAQQPGMHAQPPQRPGRFGKIAMLGVAALILMAGSGIAGGAVALAIDDSTTTVNRTYSAAPVINSADLPKIAAQVENSVVSITTGNAEGSGVILSADGYILTNNHVVEGAQGSTVTVNFADGKTARATIVGTDPRTDLAVVKAEGVSGLTAAKLGDSDAMQVGDTVLAIGSPLGLQGSVTSGIISAKDRTIQTGSEQQQNPFQQQQSTPVTSISGLLQTDAPINPGNSGGALVNTNGEVIGINTAIATSGSSTGNIGVGFAIPSNKAKEVAEALRNGDKVSHPSLGVSVNTGPNGGAVIGSVNPNSPAQKAGLQQGDVITKFGDKAINESDDLIAAVQSGKVGDQVQVTYTRNGQQETATVTLAEAS